MNGAVFPSQEEAEAHGIKLAKAGLMSKVLKSKVLKSKVDGSMAFEINDKSF